ncbi:Uncharacterized protein TCAP_02307 [Tolypocladium capitatum]|uniref:Uncharacterized protein n=1 Tax=Tolypocladium capitatum TaxID=45235 RepID=A0A2K3QJQ7_9HYPO|nr:Uncharacterized protein TCAP_02307 [Tolypocladium capitatum]
MKPSSLLALGAALDATSSLSAPAIGFEVFGRGNLPGLDGVQTANAQAVIVENNRQQLGTQGCVAAITAAITESSLRILANTAVPESLRYWHDGLGSDHDSIGLFQQRVQFYTDVACNMAAACSAAQFYRGMTAVKGWQTMDVATLCQAVQRSEMPGAYKKNVGMAKSICWAVGL